MLDLFLSEDFSLTEDAMLPSPIPGPSLVLDSGEQPLRRLIGCAVPDELPSLIDAVFSDGRVSDIVGCLRRNDVRTFIDTMDEVCIYASHLRIMG